MTHREADIRIEPIDHRGKKPDSGITHTNRMGIVNDNEVTHVEKYWNLNHSINAGNQILEVRHEVKIEQVALQYSRLQSVGRSDLRYIQKLPRQESCKTTEIYTQVSGKCLQRIVTPYDTL
ncbi:MAG TPA: hypothetical protein DEO70_05315 [Bacteroidales bacterium]|nr:hypothetical protein [Bacteroidales bacterium]